MRIYVKSTNVYSVPYGCVCCYLQILYYISRRGRGGEHTGRGQCFKVNRCTTLITRARYVEGPFVVVVVVVVVDGLTHTHTAPQTVTEVHTLI